MNMSVQKNHALNFLEGGGELGELIRNHNWKDTPLGEPEHWPKSLQTTVGIILHSSFPMFLFWGADLICFYNDAYRASLGDDGRHPLVGKRGQDVWVEVWSFIGPLIDKVMATGEAVYFEDLPLPIYRYGKLENGYWTFSYSPAYGDHGEIAGVFVTCAETTGKVTALAELSQSRNKLQFAIDAAELGTWELDPISNTFTGNDRLKEWFGLKPEDHIELPLALSAIEEEDRERVSQAIAQALDHRSGGNYDIEYTIQNVITGRRTIVRAKGKAYFDDQDKPYTFSGTLHDVTKEVTMRRQLAEEMTKQRRLREAAEISEAKFRKLIESAPAGIVMLTGKDLVIESPNKTFLDIIGKDASVVGQPLRKALPELMAENHQYFDLLNDLFVTGRSFSDPALPFRIFENGKFVTKYYNVTYTPLRNAEGQVFAILNTSLDISELIEAQKKIEEAESNLRNAVEVANLGTWSVDLTSGITTLSKRHAEIFGIGDAQDVFKETLDRIVESDKQKVLDAFNHAQLPASDGKYEAEYRIVNAQTGKQQIIQALGETYFDAQRKPLRIVGTVRDITIQRELQLALENEVQIRTEELARINTELEKRNLAEEQLNLDLMRSNQELEQFAYIASHDLQEPVRKISTFTQMLEKSIPVLNETSKNYIDKIYRSTDRMSKLIRDVLAFSQIASKSDDFEQVGLGDVIESLKGDFELLIEKKQAMIEVEKLPAVHAIPSQMQQLFGNLLSNSLKYTREGVNPVIKIESSAATKDQVLSHPQLDAGKSYFHIEFADNGIGFDQEHAHRIFRIFQRLHAKTEFEGTGIGLSICLRIVQGHGGAIDANVGANGGAVFNIYLPQVKSSD